MIHVDSKLTENRICKIMPAILKSHLQIQGHGTWILKTEYGQS